MRIALLAMTGLFAASLPLLVSADPISYDYLDLGYSKQNHDYFNGGGGYQLDGSYGLGTGFFLDAEYKHNQFKEGISPFSALDITNHSYIIGGGYHYAMTDSADLVTRAAYGRAYTDVEFVGIDMPDQNQSGHDLGVGIRWKAAPSLELNAFLDHGTLGFEQNRCAGPVVSGYFCFTTIDSGGSENMLSLGLHYDFANSFGLGLDYRHSSLQGMNEWLVSGRWYL